ncbi:hypothetical protein J2Y56_004052 [Pseudomonas sp. BE134]|nr:hypothetical protein [Pseudomonas sp. BE134]
MINIRHYKVHKISECDQASLVMNWTQWEWDTLVQPPHHAKKVGFDPRPIHKWRSNYNDLHSRIHTDLIKSLFGFPF